MLRRMSRRSVTLGMLAGVVIGAAGAAGIDYALEQRDQADAAEVDPRCTEAHAAAENAAEQINLGSTDAREEAAASRRIVHIVLAEPSCFSVAEVAAARAAVE